jgi:hypothetical protein
MQVGPRKAGNHRAAGQSGDDTRSGIAFATSQRRRTDNFRTFFRSTHMIRKATERAGKIKYGIFAWLIGLPLPIVILALFFRGCDF